MNQRRKLIVALGAGALAAPFGAFAQQSSAAMPRIGFLSLDSPDANSTLAGFREAMRKQGFVEGRNYRLDIRSGGDRYERLPDLANELVGLKVNVIVTYGSTSLQAASKATTTIPIVIATASIDPVAAGYAATLARPGGNVTGFVSMMGEVTGKRVQLLKEAIPGLRRIGVLLNPDSRGGANSFERIQAAARSLNLQIHVAEVHAADELEQAFSDMARARVGAAFVAPSNMLSVHRMYIVKLAAKYRLPAMYQSGEWVEAGGLMAYSPNLSEPNRNLAAYVEKILKGTKPGDLPIEQPMTIELAINMKTAKALGIKIPKSILVQATKVIE
jgi:putative ABC transport system substrate-binding protein